MKRTSATHVAQEQTRHRRAVFLTRLGRGVLFKPRRTPVVHLLLLCKKHSMPLRPIDLHCVSREVPAPPCTSVHLQVLLISDIQSAFGTHWIALCFSLTYFLKLNKPLVRLLPLYKRQHSAPLTLRIFVVAKEPKKNQAVGGMSNGWTIINMAKVYHFPSL